MTVDDAAGVQTADYSKKIPLAEFKDCSERKAASKKTNKWVQELPCADADNVPSSACNDGEEYPSLLY